MVPEAELTTRAPAQGRAVRGVVLMLHGGRASSHDPVRSTNTSWLRMLVLQRRLAGPANAAGVAVELLRYAERGWNADSGSEPGPVRDGRWALRQVAERYGGVPVVLVGHSMGGRAVCRLADAHGVDGLVALAPWLAPGEPVNAARGQRLMLAHGSMDRWTSPAGSLEWSVRAREVGAQVARFELPMVGHFMFARAGEWNGLVRRGTLGLLGIEPLPAAVTDAFAAPAAAAGRDGLRLPVRDL